jgi:hypothetical protein
MLALTLTLTLTLTLNEEHRDEHCTTVELSDERCPLELRGHVHDEVVAREPGGQRRVLRGERGVHRESSHCILVRHEVEHA